MIDWLAMMVQPSPAHQRNEQRRRAQPVENVIGDRLAAQRDRGLAGIVENEAGKHDPRPRGPDRALAEMAHVGVERLGARDAEKNSAQEVKAVEPVVGEEADAIGGIDRDQHAGVAGDAPEAEEPDHNKPQQHDWTEGRANPRGAERLDREQRRQDDHRGRQHIGVQSRRRDIQSFERRQHGNRRRDRAVAVDQRRAERAQHHNHRTLPLLDAKAT